MNERERIGKRIAEIRKEKGMTQEELANAAGIDRTNVAKLERGKYNVSYDILSNVAASLDCYIDLLSIKDYEELKLFKAINDAKNVFDSYNCENNSIKIFGDWAVNEVGDIINVPKRYPLYSYLLNDFGGREYWISHIAKKFDFDIDNFENAYDYAIILLNNLKEVAE